ncbi:MAG TPA: hypothetical protein VGR57_08055, partial [Ktedonobacterales bacterium]|nr:hypothetical protein [Ktedonobacterales bacterium]
LGWWQWLLIAAATILVLCCGLGVLGGALRGLAYRSPGSGSVPSGLAQTGVGDNMVLGSDYAVTGNDFAIVNQTGHFGAGDSLALVVNLHGQPFGTTSMLLQVVHVAAGGGETVVRSVGETISSPDYSELANKWLIAGALMGNNPPGVYKLELTDSPSILADASFYYTG